MNRKKGFTLVELLAVIVVLVVIILIAVNVINSRVKQAKKNSVEVNANNYIKAVNGAAALSQNIGEDMEEGTYQVRDLNKKDVKMSGVKPRRGFLYITNYNVSYGCLMYEDYRAIIIDGKTTSITTGTCNDAIFVAEYNYTGSEEVFNVGITGEYKVEVWGAQGGSYSTDSTNPIEGGYGAYSVGTISLKKGDVLYVNVGGAGEGKYQTATGGYNGGGSASTIASEVCSSGGGATHIATSSGLLSTLLSNQSAILIVAGGGGGSFNFNRYALGGSGGGSSGSTTSLSAGAGSQTSGGNRSGNGTGGSFGIGGNGASWSAGGGGGFYGGGGGYGTAGGGGSGYIGNSKLKNKEMFCYDCAASTSETSKTTANACVSSEPTANCSKKGNGYAKITLVN